MEQNPKDSSDPEELLDNIGNLDTARMTLRWALERIRGLEKNIGETQSLLKETTSARDKTVAEMDSQKHELASRTKSLEDKERFVAEMQRMLNDLFKGEVQVEDFVRLKEQVEAEKTALEGKVQRRLEELELSHQKEQQVQNEQLAEIEASYAGALSQAQKRYHTQIEGVRREHAKELEEEKEKYDAFREETLSEGRLQEDRYHRKMLHLEREFSAKRLELQKDFEALKGKIIEDQRNIWAEERTNMESLLQDRAHRITALELTIKSLETGFHEKIIAQSQLGRQRMEELTRKIREEKDSELDEERADHMKRSAQYIEELSLARREMIEREKEYKEDRIRTVEEQKRIVAEQNRLREEAVRGVQENLTAKEEEVRAYQKMQAGHHAQLQAEVTKQHKAALEDFRQSLGTAYDEERKQEREQAESDLESLRKFYESIVTREKIASQKFVEEKTREVALLQSQYEALTKNRLAEIAKEAEGDREHRKADTALLEERFKLLQETMKVQRAEYQSILEKADREYESRLKRLEAQRAEDAANHERVVQAYERKLREMGILRDSEAESHRGNRRELERAFETIASEKEARVRQLDLKELDAVRLHFQKLLEERRRDYDGQTAALNTEIEKLQNKIGRSESETGNLLRIAREKGERSLETLKAKLTPGWFFVGRALAAFLGNPKVLAAALVITLGAAGMFYWTVEPPAKNHAIPFSHTTSLVWQGNTLWASDWLDQSIHRLSMTPNGLVPDGRYAIPRSRITGMTIVGEKFYITDSLHREIQSWKMEGDRLVMEKAWPSPGDSPSALHYDGKHLWSADLIGRRIYQHLIDDNLTILTSFPADQAPIALYAEKDQFWSADAESRIIFHHRWDDSLTVIATYHHKDLETGKTPLSAFTIRDGRVWLARDGSREILERSLKSFRKENISSH